MSGFGRFERVDLRSGWPSEARDFTPWLSRVENLSLLAETLGLGPDGLEFEASEEGVGPFRADIVCRDTATSEGARVLIENQFGQSDHDHLGKLLTYAGGLKAQTIILIGEKIRDEHRAALDWLNDITGDDHNFFACELELWRIGDSLPAPKFNLVVQPNDWSREIRRSLPGEGGAPSELKLTYMRFWEDFSRLCDATGTLRRRKPAPKQWMDYSLGRTGIVLRLEISERESRLKIGVYLQGESSKKWFASLENDRPRIDEAFGQALDWDRLPHRQSCRIGLMLENADPTDEDDWPRQHQWLLDMAKRFDRTFRPVIAKLDTGGQNTDSSEASE